MDTRTNILLQNFNLQNLSVVHHIIRLAPQLEPQPQIWWNYMSSSGGAYLGVHVFQLHPFHKHVVVEFGIPSVALSHLLLQSLVYKLDIPDEHKKWTRVTFTMFLSAMSLPHRIWQKFSSHGINPCTLSITGINFEGFLDIQLCQIQVDKFNVGLRPSVQGFNICALKF